MDSTQALRRQITSWYRDNRMVLTQTPDLSALAPDAANLTKWESICKQITEPVNGKAQNHWYRPGNKWDAGVEKRFRIRSSISDLSVIWNSLTVTIRRPQTASALAGEQKQEIREACYESACACSLARLCLSAHACMRMRARACKGSRGRGGRRGHVERVRTRTREHAFPRMPFLACFSSQPASLVMLLSRPQTSSTRTGSTRLTVTVTAKSQRRTSSAS